MRLKSLKNITRERVMIKFSSGMSASLLPGCELENVAITDASAKEIKDKVFMIQDLTEVNESNKSKTQLRD